MTVLSVGSRFLHILVTPPQQEAGVANILVALGDAGIGVTQVEPRADDGGIYRLTVTTNPELAARILEGIGCVVSLPTGALAI